MKDGVFNDALCGRTWTGARKDGVGMGYVCEFNSEPECTPKEGADKLLEDDHYVIRYNQNTNWANARRECKSLGSDWDLAIFNAPREHKRIRDIISDNCLDKYAFWVGYTEKGGNAKTVFDQAVTPKEDGFTTSIELPWDLKTNMVKPEPNDWTGEEECVRMRKGVMNDAKCKNYWVGGKRNNVGMGFICEKHNTCEDKRGESPSSYKDEKYIIESGDYISAEQAKGRCMANGAGWNLAVIEDRDELDFINSKLTGCSPYWLGMKEKNGLLYSGVDGSDVQFAPWDTHIGHGFNTNPSTPFDDKEECVRMRGGVYNDAPCDDTTGYFSSEKMGYVCEYTTPLPADSCVECGLNKAVLPWETQRGCSPPQNCYAQLQINDAWRIGDGKSRPVRYGFMGLIKVPEEVIDSGDRFSILIRFSKKINHGHFQLWNMRFFNFYNGGYEVLIHSKWWNTDRHDPYSIGFVAEELNGDEYPEILFWTHHQKRHQCFQASMHHSGNRDMGDISAYDAFLAQEDLEPEEVTSVRFKDGKIVSAKGGKRN